MELVTQEKISQELTIDYQKEKILILENELKVNRKAIEGLEVEKDNLKNDFEKMKNIQQTMKEIDVKVININQQKNNGKENKRQN